MSILTFELSGAANEEFVNLPALADRLAAQDEGIAQEKHIHLAVEIEPDVLVLGDPAALRRVLAQLLDTALENTPPGGRVTLAGTNAHGIATITITTAWPSPSPVPPPHEWRAFSAAGSARLLRGFGFQPSFVGRIVREHSGHLVVQHRPGEGSRFVLRIPVAHDH